MCDGDIGDTRHHCLPAFCQQLQSCPGLGAYLAPSPLKGICLATGQHHPAEAWLLALVCPAPEPSAPPSCGTLAQSRRAEHPRETGGMGKTTHQHVPPGSPAFPKHTPPSGLWFPSSLLAPQPSSLSSWETPALSQAGPPATKLSSPPRFGAWPQGTRCHPTPGRERSARALLKAKRQ